MEKAFDTKVLLKKLADKGLVIAEEAAEILIAETFDWTSESLAVSKNPIALVGVAVIPTLKAAALKAADKIDHIENN